jgi:hypothetical protein
VASKGKLSAPDSVALQIASSLDPAGNVHGRILLDGRLAGAIASGEPGIWSFDFRNAPGVAVERLRVVAGTVLATGPERISFRLNGDPGERVLFDFQLE